MTWPAQAGTPCYVYSRAAIEDRYRAFDQAFGERPHLVCYAVKANSNLAVLNVLARLGSGFDIVSGGELERVLAAGGKASQIVFSGVGKGEDEMRRALEAGIACFNVESEAELEALSAVAAAMNQRAPVSLRASTRTSIRHPSLHRHRPQGKQVRHPHWRGEEGLSARRRAARHPHRGRRLPHRLADHRTRSLR